MTRVTYGSRARSARASTMLGCSVMLATVAASAQEATPSNAKSEDVLETIVVTGIRRSIDDAIALKRDSGSIVEAVSAEDIGKLPDTSIADSISRLPGLTAQRAEGRASAISLRGTDPGFTTALLNGREQVSTGDNRSVEFDQYPSELLSAVVVYKTPDAALVGQGLAGTIDLRTRRPLEYGQRAVVLNVRGERNSQGDLGANSKDEGYRASFSYIDQLFDNRLGVTLGVARLDSPMAIRGAGTYEPWHASGTQSAGFLNPTGVVNPGVGANDFITDGMKVRSDMGKNRRDGAMAAIEWRPSDSFTSLLDVYYTKRRQVDNARSLEVNLASFPAPCCDGTFPNGTVFGYSNPTVVNGTVVAADLNQRIPLVRNFLYKTKDSITALGWNNKWLAGAWTLNADVSYSKAEREEQHYETNAQYEPSNSAPAGSPRYVYDNGWFSISPDSMPRLGFDRNYADPAGVRIGPSVYGAGYSRIPHIEDELKSARVDVARQLDGWLTKVAVGLNYSNREKSKEQPETTLSTIDNRFYQVDSRYLLNPANLSYAGTGSILAWNVPAVLGAYYQPITYADATTPGYEYLVGKNWTVEEKVGTAYLRGEIEHELSSTATLRGNVGVQVVSTDQSSSALRRNSALNLIEPFSAGKTFTDVLPAINLALALPAEQTVRLSVAREIARPRMDQLKASSEQGASVQNGGLVPSGVGGNPELDPWRADAFDLSYEKYLAPGAYVSVAAFYKKLDSYIYNQTDASHDFTTFLADLPYCYQGDLGNPADPSDDVCPPVASTTGLYSQPRNGEGGNLKGMELALSLTGELFSDKLRGFGTILSFAQTDSSITIQDPPGNNYLGGNGLGKIPLPGLSKTVWSATAYYEVAGFSARVATRSRSKYIGEITDFANERALKYVRGDRITDAQLGYEFDEGTLKGLSVLFQINNLTNEPYISYAMREQRVQTYQEYGRQFLVGVNYRL
ncbi:TonB-dependent receptor [Steroidobacter sp.]|uniref:TonB-dependent receptor n=1 Tax=Steroidobacter sp. TaxID=1978227 RepID=UPI001A5ADE0C|nr:TonB-dependent receptor [Steroidobacter sp.]MBL8270907.1 TonB-dependent receptor [Steroidobacter sp.]